MTVYVHKDRGQGRFLFGRTPGPDPWCKCRFPGTMT
jgi:hypothetical protein